MIAGPPFMQALPQSSQQPLGPNHPGLPHNPNATNPAMMLGNSSNPMSSQQQRYMQQMQHAELRQSRQMSLRQAQGGQPLMGPSGGAGPGAAGAPHMARNPAMGFNTNMMQQPQVGVNVRRVTSQPQLNQTSGQLGGMSPNIVNNSLGMAMNSQGNMNNIHPGFRMQPQPQIPMQGQMPPEMSMSLNRAVGNPSMPPGRTGSAQAQVMNSLSQPPSLSHTMGPHQNQFQNPITSQHQPPQKISSPRPGSHHSQTHTPSMSMATPGPSRTPVSNRSQMPPGDGSLSFMDFPNSQFTQGHGNPRMPNGQFPFVPSSSTPPVPIADMPQTMPTNMGTPGGTPNRTNFPLTPAQQLEHMNSSPENYPGHFAMGPPQHVPPRPPSQHNLHPPLPQLPQHQQSHPSPPQPDLHMNSLPQRPQSQPQTLPRPSSRQAHTPRTSHPQLPPPGVPQPPGARITLPSHSGPGPQMQIAGGGPHMAIAPRPPQLPVTSGPSNAAPPTQAPGDASPPGSASIPRSVSNTVPLPLGSGQGLMRLLQFSGVLASESKTQKLQLSWWNELIKEYFTPKAVMKFTLWKDNQRNEAKPFEIGVPILPRFFLVTTQSGVKSMTLSLDGARERMYAHGHSIVECVGAVWTYKYNNGYTVTLRGPLTAHIMLISSHPPGSTQAQGSQFLLKFEDFQFDANYHDKYISLDSVMGPRSLESPKTPRDRNASTPALNGSSSQQQQLEEDKKWEEPRVTIERASLPGEPVNAFGIPQATMRCLELAESVSQMTDLISFSNELSLGPLDALKEFAYKIRESQPYPPPQNLMNGANHIHMFSSMHSNPSSMMLTAPVTLYSSAPPSVTNPPPNTPSAPSMNSPKNAPLSASSSPQKQHKTIPQQNQASSSSSTAPTASPSMSSGTTVNSSNVPSKRKQASDASSSTTATPELPQKRTRKRRQTGAG